jgi:tripartite-type tricarboxylate transporter receptor subunit TctC
VCACNARSEIFWSRSSNSASTSTGASRAPQLPDVPTVAELGYPGFSGEGRGGVFGIVEDRQSLAQTFDATDDAFTTLSWFDANRPS